MKLILLLFLILFTSCEGVKKPPKAVKGVLDLGAWDFKTDGPVKLSGEWKFHWQELKEPNLKNIGDEGLFVKVPGPWTKKERPSVKEHGHGTYILEVKGVQSKEVLALTSPSVYIAHKTYLVPSSGDKKSTLIFKQGKVSAKKEEEVAESYKSRIKSLGHHERFFLVVQVSNFHHGRSGSMNSTPTLGEESQMVRRFSFSLASATFILGILFIISFYHLIHYFQRKENKELLYFGLFCGLLFLRELQIGGYLTWLPLDGPTHLRFVISTYIEYLTLFIMVHLFMMFLGEVFDRDFKLLKRTSFWLLILFSIFYTFTLPIIYAQDIFVKLMNGSIAFLCLWALIVILKLAFKNVDYSRGFLISYLVLLFGVFHDILVTQQHLYSFHILSYCFIATILIQSSVLSKKAANTFRESERLADLLEDARNGLEKLVNKKTRELQESLHETTGMLSNINKGIFSIDKNGTVLGPVSIYSKLLFKKDIVGENGLNLLFFHLKDGSDLKNQLVDSFQKVFGKRESTFLSLKGGFPSRVIQPDKKRTKGRVLDITTIPLLNADSKVEKLMFIIDDVTESTEEYNQFKEMGHEYKVFMEILPLERKDKIVSGLSSFINNTISSLGKLMEPGSEEFSKKEINTLIFNLIKKFKTSDASRLKELEHAMTRIQEEGNVPKDTEPGKVLVWAVEKLSGLFLVLNRYVESFNFIHKNGMGPGVIFSFPKGFEKSLDEKRKDLDTVMKNLLEYVFLVRELKDLSEENISNAPKKARLYNEFDETISKIMFRSRLIAFLLKVSGKNEESTHYMNLSELLEQMPSKEKLNEAALINHLMVPYKKIKG